MKAFFKTTLMVMASCLGCIGHAQVTLFEHEDYAGRSFTMMASEAVDNFLRHGFNDRASSAIVAAGVWNVCDDTGFHGRCMVLRPGHYRSLREMNMSARLTSARAVGRDESYSESEYAPLPLVGQIVFFEYDRFHGRMFSTEGDVANFREHGFSDRALSVVVLDERWEVCDDVRFLGRCMILQPGRYPDLRSMGLTERVSSARAVSSGGRLAAARYAPRPAPVYDWRRRPGEHIYQAFVTATRAVYTMPKQQCWLERDMVPQHSQRIDSNVGGAAIGGVIGGILGHATGAGLDAGANRAGVGMGFSNQVVPRCTGVPTQSRLEYWDVTYYYRSVEHHMQTLLPPGPAIAVNENGEPRL